VHAESFRKLKPRPAKNLVSLHISNEVGCVEGALAFRWAQALYRAVAEQAQHVWVGIGGDGVIRFGGFGHIAFARG
jgi:hypothetical protein